MQDEDRQDEQRQVGTCVGTSSDKEVLVQIDAFSGRDGVIPILLDRLTNPREAKRVQRAVDDRNAHHCANGDTKAGLERRYS